MLLFKLAFRNVLRNRKRSLFTILSMGGGYVLLSIMISVVDGSYGNMIDLFTRDHTGHVQIHYKDYFDRPSLYKTLDDYPELIEKLNQRDEVVSVAPRIYSPSLAYGKEKTFPATVVGIDPALEAKTTLLAEKITAGHYIDSHMTADGYYPAMMGAALAKSLHLNVGDELVLISQGIDGSIANDVFTVAAIVGTDSSYERMNVYISMAAMQSFLAMHNQAHELAIRLKSYQQAEGESRVLSQYLNNAALTVAPWQVIEKSFYNAMQADKKGNFVSMGVLIFIVSIGVLNTVLMGMLERTREFGVLRALGTRPSMLFVMIVIEACLLAIASCVLGLVIALPINYWFATVGISLSQPIDLGGVAFQTYLGVVNAKVFLMPALVVVLSAVVVSLLPALRAARISPLQALKAT